MDAIQSPIEPAHLSNNVLTRLFVNIRNWFDRQKAIEIRTHMADVPDVQKARDCMDKLSKRKLSASSVETKETKKAESKAKKSAIRAGTVADIENLTLP